MLPKAWLSPQKTRVPLGYLTLLTRSILLEILRQVVALHSITAPKRDGQARPVEDAKSMEYQHTLAVVLLAQRLVSRLNPEISIPEMCLPTQGSDPLFLRYPRHPSQLWANFRQKFLRICKRNISARSAKSGSLDHLA